VRMIIADTEGENEKAIGFFNRMGFSARSQHVWLAKTLQRPGKSGASKQGARRGVAARRAKTASDKEGAR
jgi:hypothetical protein